jgi:hypothetical protein
MTDKHTINLTEPVYILASEIDEDLANYLHASNLRWAVGEKFKDYKPVLDILKFDLHGYLSQVIAQPNLTPISEFKKLIGYNMEKFDIERCKEDDGRAMLIDTPVKLVVFEQDLSDCLLIEHNGFYKLVTIHNLSNIPRKKKFTIYVYRNDHGQIFASETGGLNSCTLIDIIEREYPI